MTPAFADIAIGLAFLVFALCVGLPVLFDPNRPRRNRKP